MAKKKNLPKPKKEQTKPTVTVTRRPGPATLTIRPNMHSWYIDRDVFAYIVDALKAKAWELSGGDEDDHDDAVYVESIADAIRKAIDAADGDERRDRNAVLGGP